MMMVVVAAVVVTGCGDDIDSGENGRRLSTVDILMGASVTMMKLERRLCYMFCGTFRYIKMV